MVALARAACLGLFLFAGAAAAKSSPLERTQALLDTLKKVKTADDGKELSAADQKANAALFAELDGFFDFAALTLGPLEPHKAKLTASEREKVASMFGELIRLVSYPSSGAFLRRAKYKLAAVAGKSDVEMQATLPDEDFQTSVLFHWHEQNGALELADVSFDGSSLVKEHSNLFGRILNKEGSAGLLKKLTARLEKERQKHGS